MELKHGKAISGGRELTEDELKDLAHEQLASLREAFSAKGPRRGDKTDDTMSRRLADELRLVQRMLELVEAEMDRKGQHVAAREIEKGEEAIEDIADIVEADDRCEALEDVHEDIARRITRRALDGSGSPCDNRRPSILRKVN